MFYEKGALIPHTFTNSVLFHLAQGNRTLRCVRQKDGDGHFQSCKIKIYLQAGNGRTS